MDITRLHRRERARDCRQDAIRATPRAGMPRPPAFLRNLRKPILFGSYKRKEAQMSKSVQTTDHKEIKNWIEERGGHPSRVKTSGEGGILRVDFGKPEDALEQIEWDDFFAIFEESKLSFLYQEETEGGKTSRFNKFVSRTKH
jgi:hypothetical protein